MKTAITVIFSAIPGILLAALLWNFEISHKILVLLFGVTISSMLYLAIVIKMALNEQQKSSGRDIPQQAAE